MVYGPKDDGTYVVEFKTAEGRSTDSTIASASRKSFFGPFE
jgi:hypothetical protein